ncbi:hypothetical protein BDZ97DRAFT_114091 [Flammula alnicola]|nr:hypothetical protein BDZ97DRAFT_114091 [Flammula alnicola]
MARGKSTHILQCRERLPLSARKDGKEREHSHPAMQREIATVSEGRRQGESTHKLQCRERSPLSARKDGKEREHSRAAMQREITSVSEGRGQKERALTNCNAEIATVSEGRWQGERALTNCNAERGRHCQQGKMARRESTHVLQCRERSPLSAREDG